MALNIKDPETERLAGEVAELAGESKTGAVRTALRERKARLMLARGVTARSERIQTVLEREVWPTLPAGVRGSVITKDQEEAILGHGSKGT
jgi:antitoxin VapB